MCVESDVITDRGGRCEHNNKDFPYLAKQVYRVISTVTLSASEIKRWATIVIGYDDTSECYDVMYKDGLKNDNPGSVNMR